MRPSDALRCHREAVREAALRHGLINPRVFGSTATGKDADGSDLDLLVDPLPSRTGLGLGARQDELETLLGIRVDVLTAADLPKRFRASVLEMAQPL